MATEKFQPASTELADTEKLKAITKIYAGDPESAAAKTDPRVKRFLLANGRST